MFHHFELPLVLLVLEVGSCLVVLSDVLLQLLGVLISQPLVLLDPVPDAPLLLEDVIIVLFQLEVLDLFVEVLQDAVVEVLDSQALQEQRERLDAVLIHSGLQVNNVSLVVAA